jgi:hypothetical protein
MRAERIILMMATVQQSGERREEVGAWRGKKFRLTFAMCAAMNEQREAKIHTMGRSEIAERYAMEQEKKKESSTR